MVQFHPFACGCPVFPTPFIEETALSQPYLLDSVIVNLLTICAWFCFRALFCSIDLFMCLYAYQTQFLFYFILFYVYYGCAGPLLLRAGFSLLWQVRAAL